MTETRHSLTVVDRLTAHQHIYTRHYRGIKCLRLGSYGSTGGKIVEMKIRQSREITLSIFQSLYRSTPGKLTEYHIVVILVFNNECVSIRNEYVVFSCMLHTYAT